jgi:hypothetical protein
VRDIYVCGGDFTPGPRDSDCPSELHDYPLPAGYCDAFEEADSRISRGWSNRKCDQCGLHGWAPGRPHSDPARNKDRVAYSPASPDAERPA